MDVARKISAMRSSLLLDGDVSGCSGWGAGEVGGVKSESNVISELSKNGVTDRELGADEGGRFVLVAGFERNRPVRSRNFFELASLNLGFSC